MKDQDEKTLNKRAFYMEAIKRAEKNANDAASFMNWSKVEIEERITQIQQNYEKFELKCLQVSCDIELESDEKAEIIIENEAIETLFIQLKTKLRTRMQMLSTDEQELQAKMHNLSVDEKANTVQIQQELGVVSVNQSVVSKKQNVFPGVFNGNRFEWKTFKGEYEAAVHNNDAMTPDEKLCVLKEAVHGQLNETILSFYAADYAKAWQKLCDAFDNAYKQAQWCLRKLSTIPPMKQANGVEICSIVTRANKIEAILKQSALMEHFDAIMAFIIIDKLDVDTERMWERHRVALANSWAQVSEASSEERKASNYIPNWESVKDFLVSELDLYGEGSVQMHDCVSSKNSEISNKEVMAHASQEHEAVQCEKKRCL